MNKFYVFLFLLNLTIFLIAIFEIGKFCFEDKYYSYDRSKNIIKVAQSSTSTIKSLTLLESEGVSYLPREDRFNIFLIWYGDTFPDIYFKGLETLIFHHQKADILIFSNDLNETIIYPFLKKGFNVHIVRFNITKMVENKPGYDFVIKANRLLNGEKLNGLHVSRVHLSDFLRYFLIYNYGGFYIDTDSFVMKSLDKFKNWISVPTHLSYGCSTKVFNSPNAKNFSCISNSIYHFDKHHPFMKDALINYDIWWVKNQGYAPGGAVMLMDLIANNFDKIDFLPQKEIFCFNHLGRAKNLANESDIYLQDIINNCYTIQLLGAGSSTNSADNFTNTIVGRIYNKFKVL